MFTIITNDREVWRWSSSRTSRLPVAATIPGLYDGLCGWIIFFTSGAFNSELFMARYLHIV